MKLLKILFVSAFIGLMSGGCVTIPQPEVPSTPTIQSPSPTATSAVLPQAVIAARAKLADQLQIPVDQVKLISFEAKDWPDGCLGAANPGEMCIQMITPGYQVVLEANAMQYTFRTNQDGSVIRPEPKATATPITDLPIAVQNARQALATKLDVTPDTIQVVSFEAVNWPDGCMGVMQKGVMCTDVVTPGYRVILATADGSQYEYHTNITGQYVVLAKSPMP